MGDTLAVYVVQKDGKTCAYSEEMLQSVGLGDRERLEGLYAGKGYSGHWHEVEFEEVTAATYQQISAAAATSPYAVSAIRAHAVIRRWTFTNEKGEPIPATVDGYQHLKKAIKLVVDAHVDKRLDEAEIDDVFFGYMREWKRNSDASAQEKA